MNRKEGTTRSFVLRVDSETMSAIEAWAEDEFRSVNGQIQWILAEALRKSGRLRKGAMADASQKRKREEGVGIRIGSDEQHPQLPEGHH